MKSVVLALALGILGSLGSGCGSVQVTDDGASDPNRTVTGTVELGDTLAPSPDLVITVRVVDMAHKNYRNPNAALGEPTATAAIAQPPEILGEQKIQGPATTSVPFAVKFYATDEQMSGGLHLEARISVKGKVRFFNLENYAVNSGNIDSPRRIYVNEMR